MRSELGRSYAQAWSSKRPERVAEFYAEDGQIVINNGSPLRGHEAISNMAAGFYAAFPDLIVHCDDFRLAGTHALFAWTLEGHHAETKRRVRIAGWEEWDLDGGGKVLSSRGWFDTVAYENQIAGRASPL
ncbi:MAG: nuclear transport factor 2 family protein [Pseudomonadota bacterium]